MILISTCSSINMKETTLKGRVTQPRPNIAHLSNQNRPRKSQVPRIYWWPLQCCTLQAFCLEIVPSDPSLVRCRSFPACIFKAQDEWRWPHPKTGGGMKIRRFFQPEWVKSGERSSIFWAFKRKNRAFFNVVLADNDLIAPGRWSRHQCA